MGNLNFGVYSTFYCTYSCQAKFSRIIALLQVVIVNLLILFIWGMFAVIGVMICKHKYLSNSDHYESSLKEAFKNFILFLTLSVLLGLSNIFSNLLFIVEFIVYHPHPNPLLRIFGITIINMQGPALLVFQGVKLKEVQTLWHRWINLILERFSPAWLPSTKTSSRIALM